MIRKNALSARVLSVMFLGSALFAFEGCVNDASGPEETSAQSELSLVVGGGAISLAVGEAVQLEVSVNVASGATRLYTLKYQSADTSIASVDAQGTVKGLANGSTQITVTATLVDTGASASASVVAKIGSGTTDVGGGSDGGVGSGGGGDGGTLPGTRDPLKQPFASDSIWNMPIGSGAVYAPSHLLDNSNPSNNVWAPFPGPDEDQIILSPTAPLTPVYYNGAAWSGGNRCTGGTGTPRTSVPMPSNYVVPNGGGNNSAAFLMPDKRTLIQMQPLARCTAGSFATSFAFIAPVDIYGAGIAGAHGGSGLSSIGGTLRMGELRPGGQGPRHALKVAVYGKSALFKCTTRSQCYRWPASTGDSYAVGWYGSNNGNAVAAMKMGALLAIPASTNIAGLGLETEPGRQLAWTMQNYGAYIDDDMYGSPGFLIDTETGPAGSKVAEFQKDYGFAFLQKVNSPNAWLRDVKRIMGALSVVDNNGPTSIGGGGTPRQPLAPAIKP